MTSSYGYQRPLSSEEELYLQNQALRAELQRRDEAKQGFKEAVGGGLAAGLGLGAAAAGAFGLASALSPAQRAKIGRNLSSTVDLSKHREAVKDIPAKGLEAVESLRQKAADIVRPSQPAPATSAERLQRIDEATRQARTERPQGVRQVDLSAEGGEYKSPYRAEPTERELYPSRYEYPAISKEVLEARRQQATQDLLNVVEQTKGAYQETIPGINPTLMAVRGAAREADELAGVVQPIAPSRPLSATPEQIPLPLTSAIAKETNTVQAAAQSDFGPQQFLRDAGYVEAESLVDQQRLGAIGRIDQFANAANPAEDQATGRVKMALQRNEDVNLAAIEMAEDAVDTQIAKAAQGDPAVASVTELDSAINQAASTLPDGLPVDQAERLNIRTQGIDLRTGERFPLASERPYRGGLQPGMQLEAETQAPSKGMEAAQKFLTSERAEIASQLGEQGLPATASRVEAELANRLSGPKAWEYGPEYTQRKQALQLGATYDPDLLESVATGVKPSGEVTIAGETVPVSSLREPVVMEETAQRLQERVAEKKDWLGNIRLEEQNNQIRISRELDKLSTRDQNISNYIDYVESEFPRKVFYSSPYERNITAKKQYEAEGARIEQEQISSQMENLLQQARKSQRRVAGAERSTQEQIANLQVPEKLKSGIEEGQRVYFEQDPVTGAPIPGTQELRSERYAIETEAKRGGGRQAVEYDPLGQSGQAKDVYGTRLSTALTDDPTKRPTKTGPSRQPLTQPVTPQGLRSVDVTRDIMRIEKSAPPEKAKQMVAEYLRKLQG